MARGCHVHRPWLGLKYSNDNVVTVLVQSQKLIFQVDAIFIIESIKEMDSLRKKLKGQCPCGHCFETFSFKNEAIATVKLHVESCHKDLLPFGITNDEALTLLNEGHKEIKPKNATRTLYSVQTESAYSFKNITSTSQSSLDRHSEESIEVEQRRTPRKNAQLIV